MHQNSNNFDAHSIYKGFNEAINIGDLCSLLSGVFWAVGAASLKRWPGSPTLTITSVQLMVTTLVGLGLGLALFEYPTPDMDSLKAGFALAFFTSVFVLLLSAPVARASNTGASFDWL